MFEQILIRFRGGPISSNKDEDEESDENSSDTATSPSASDGVVARETLQLPLSRSVGCPPSPSPSLRFPSPSPCTTINSASNSNESSPSPSPSPSPSLPLSLSSSPSHHHHPSLIHHSSLSLQTPPASITSANMAKKSTRRKEPLAQPSTGGGEAKTRGQKRKAAEMGGPALAPVADRDGGSPPPEKRVTRAVAAREKEKEKETEKEKTTKTKTKTTTEKKKVERKGKGKAVEVEREKSVEVRKRKRGGEVGEEAVAVGDAEEAGVGGAPEAPASAPSGRTAAKGGQRKGTSAQPRAKRPTRSAKGQPPKKRALHKLLCPGPKDKIGFPWWLEETEEETETEEEEGEMELRGRKRKADEFVRWVKRSRADSLEALVELDDEEQEEEEGQGAASARKQHQPPSFPEYVYSDEVKQAPLPVVDPLADSRFQEPHNKLRNKEAAFHREERVSEDTNLKKYKKLWDELEEVAHDDDLCFEVLGVETPTSPTRRKSLLRKKRRLVRELREIVTRAEPYKEEQRRLRLKVGDEERLDVTYAGYLRKTKLAPLKLRSRLIERHHWKKA
ncbi:hypothetical protein TWF281_007313 [Arthrobotrys megalospora]